MTYYVYENWRADDKAVVHRADCSFCNSGQGAHRNTMGNANGRWWGAFDTFERARQKAESLGRRECRVCGICLPETSVHKVVSKRKTRMATYKEIIEYVKRTHGKTIKTCWIADMKKRCGLPVRMAYNRIDPNVRTNPCPDEFVEIIKEAFHHFNMI